MTFSSLIASLALLLPAPQRAAEGERPPRVELLKVSSWDELLQRDARVSFGLRTPSSALRELEFEGASELRLAAAVLALGAGKVSSERPRIDSLADSSKGELKRAAIWALGALRSPGDVARLEDFAGRKLAAVAEAGLFALAINGTPEARAALRKAAQDNANPHAIQAREALAFLDQPPRESEAARAYFDLRFEAARRHGLVDGQAWESLLLDDLAKNQKFLARLIYRGAAALRRQGVRDHFLEVTLAGAPPERLRGVVQAIPGELSQLIENELFKPLDTGEWAILLSAIDEQRLEALTVPILRRAWEEPSLRAVSARLMTRAGVEGARRLLEVHLRSDVAGERAEAAEGLGAAADPSFVPDLSALESDSDAAVRAAGLVARMRLGDSAALALFRKRLALDEEKLRDRELHADVPALLEALIRGAQDPRLRPIVLDLLPKIPERVRSRFSAELLLAGHEDSREVVREALRRERPTGALGARLVAALGLAATAPDLALMRDLFPLGDEFEVDVELACALLRAKDKEVVPFLRSALWSEPWNRSVLAGALWIEVSGTDALRLELQAPPQGASQRDLRRVGFALGEWGGLVELEWLAARVGPAEPALQGAVLGALGARTH